MIDPFGLLQFHEALRAGIPSKALQALRALALLAWAQLTTKGFAASRRMKLMTST